MNTRYILTLLFLASSIISVSSNAAENDFDQVCGYFQQLEQLPNVDAMTHVQRNDFILKKISQNLQPESNARVAWESISNAMPNQRYELYKSAAESVYSKTWQCPAMKKLATKTGEF